MQSCTRLTDQDRGFASPDLRSPQSIGPPHCKAETPDHVTDSFLLAWTKQGREKGARPVKSHMPAGFISGQKSSVTWCDSFCLDLVKLDPRYSVLLTFYTLIFQKEMLFTRPPSAMLFNR